MTDANYIEDDEEAEIEAPPINIFDILPPAYFAPWNDGLSGEVSEMWFPGGRYSGKSTYLARFLVASICDVGNEQAHAVVFRKHQTNLRNSVYNEVIRAIHDLGVDYLFEKSKSPLCIRRKDTGQMIQFCGLDDARKHKSEKPSFGYYKYIWFEEADEFDGWDEIDQTIISYQRADVNFISLFSFNPPRSITNWCNQKVAERAPRRRVYRTDYRDLVDIGAVPERVLERIIARKKENYDDYRHVFLGVPTGTGGEIFTNVVDRQITDEEIAAFEDKRYGMDFGMVNDPTVLEGCYYDPDTNYLYIFDEEVLQHPFYTTIHKMLERRRLTDEEIIADTAPAGWIQNINSLGANLKGCYKADDWREECVSWLRSLAKIIIDSDRCPLAWREFSTWEYDTVGGKPKEKLPKRDDHAIDAVRYSLEAIIKSILRKRVVTMPIGIKRKFR